MKSKSQQRENQFFAKHLKKMRKELYQAHIGTTPATITLYFQDTKNLILDIKHTTLQLDNTENRIKQLEHFINDFQNSPDKYVTNFISSNPNLIGVAISLIFWRSENGQYLRYLKEGEESAPSIIPYVRSEFSGLFSITAYSNLLMCKANSTNQTKPHKDHQNNQVSFQLLQNLKSLSL